MHKYEKKIFLLYQVEKDKFFFSEDCSLFNLTQIYFNVEPINALKPGAELQKGHLGPQEKPLSHTWPPNFCLNISIITDKK